VKECGRRNNKTIHNCKQTSQIADKDFAKCMPRSDAERLQTLLKVKQSKKGKTVAESR
jgi:hypothetical protein